MFSEDSSPYHRCISLVLLQNYSRINDLMVASANKFYLVITSKKIGCVKTLLHHITKPRRRNCDGKEEHVAIRIVLFGTKHHVVHNY